MQVLPGRTITGMSAILLPHLDPTAVDWASLDAHIVRTHEAGLTPAVNMDTGYVQLLDADTRTQVLDRAAAITGGRLRSRRVRGRRTGRLVRPRRLPPGRRRDHCPRRPAGGVPIARSERPRRCRLARRPRPNRLPPRTIYRVRTGPHVRALWPHRVAEHLPGAAGYPPVHRGQALLAEPANWSGTGWRCATRCAPISWCSPATTWPSTW